MVFLCPDPDCPCVKGFKREGVPCPECQTPSKSFGFFTDAGALISQKQTRKRMSKKIKEGAKEILISDEMTDEEIRKKIYEDMMNLAMHEAGTAWMRLGTLLSGSSTDAMLGAGFKALIDQNKIIIRQNELILRALHKSR